MTGDGRPTLFDLIGREWAGDEAQAVVSHYAGMKTITLDAGCIYDFRDIGVKIFADKTADGNKIRMM